MNKRLIGHIGRRRHRPAGRDWTQGQPTKDPVSVLLEAPHRRRRRHQWWRSWFQQSFRHRPVRARTYYNAVCAFATAQMRPGRMASRHRLSTAFMSRRITGMPLSSGCAEWRASASLEIGNMPPVPQALTEGELGAIVAYVRELQRANGIN